MTGSEWTFVPGLQLSAALFESAVQPLMARHYPKLRYSFARLAHGSAVLGFDTPVSMDHGWGPRGTLFLRREDIDELAPELTKVFANEFPLEVLGVPTNLDALDINQARPHAVSEGPVAHGVRFSTPEQFFMEHLGFDPVDGVKSLDWLAVPSQRLRTIASGKIFHDTLKALGPRCDAVRWYPQDLWAYLMATQWRRIGQEEAFVGRSGEVGDELGSRVLASRLTREIMRLAFLQERVYPPYSKWFGRAFAELDCACALGAPLEAAGDAETWRQRAQHLNAAYRLVAEMHNKLELGDNLSPQVRLFHGRPYKVIGAERFAVALETAAAGSSADLPKGIGAVWQLSDSTDLLENVTACRSVVAALIA